MIDAHDLPFPWRRTLWAALALALLFTTHNIFMGGNNPREWGPAEILVNQVIVWSLWLAVVPIALHIARRGREQGWSGHRQVLLQVVMALAIATLHAAAAGLLRWMVGISVYQTVPRVVAAAVTNSFAPNILRYWLIAAACHAFVYHHHVRRQDARAARLEAGAVEAQLESLRARLHPHFLFNTLNSIGALIVQDPRAAQAMLDRLGELLRAALTGDGRTEVTLGEEIALVTQYADIEKMRFQDRLDVRIDIPSALDAALVPQLILQPLVENAVRHGIVPLEQGGRVLVSASADEGRLTLRVENDGVAGDLENGARAPGGGFGLHSTRARLAHMYGAAASFAIERAAPAVTRATITLPLRLSGRGADDDRVA